MGAVLGIIHKIDDMNRNPCGYANTVIGAALVGGTLGYLGSFVRPLSDLSARII
jgi:flagellar motor component MotA